MPNNVINEIVFKGVDKNVQEEILKKVLNKEGKIDFNILVPSSLNIWHGNVGEKEERAFGKKNWHNWNIENWGTKWNAYGQKNIEENVIQSEDTLTIIFQTAWSPPRVWLCALFNSTYRSFEHIWLSEGDTNAVIAKYFFVKDEFKELSPAWEESETEDKEINDRLHILLWGEAV